jgi:hypothetical protein
MTLPAQFDQSAIPPPSGKGLTPGQREILSRISSAIHALHYEGSRIVPLQAELVDLLASACQDLDATGRVYSHLTSCVRWYRLSGYWLSYFFQLVMLGQQSLYHIYACDLYSDAQAHQYDDLAMSSLENAYTVLQRNRPGIESDLFESIDKHVRAKLEIHFKFYARWCRPFDYRHCNPLAENPHHNLTLGDLRQAFLSLRKGTHGGPAAVSALRPILLTIIEDCSGTEHVYYRVVARSYLAHLLWELEPRKGHEQSLDQYEEAITEARGADLEAELGHLYRHYGWALSVSGRHEEAIRTLEAAYSHDDHSVFAYWRALDARELGDAWLRRAGRGSPAQTDASPNKSNSTEFTIEKSKLTRPLLERALEAYRVGRLHFQEHMLGAHLPVGRAIKLQMFRSYSENGIEIASALDSAPDVLAELDMYVPRESAEAMVIVEAARELGVGTAPEVRRKWETFHRHLNTVPDNFADYLASIPADRDPRQEYARTRLRLAPRLAWIEQSDSAVNKLVSMRLPGVDLLLLFVGPERTWMVLWLGETGNIVVVRDRWAPEPKLREVHKAHLEALALAHNLEDPREALQAAVDQLLEAHDTFLGRALEGLLPYIRGHHLKLFPVMQLNAVPIHAIRVADKRLIDWCDVSYCQSLVLFEHLRAMAAPKTVTGATLGMVHDENAPFFGGIIDTLSARYGDRFSVLPSPNWEELRSALEERSPDDLLFACHGVYEPSQPAASRLTIGPPEGISFSKMFAEIDLPHIRSVIMGACESGLGRAEISSEYIGLPNVFLSAGVRYVVASMWSVNALATAILLGRLFEILAEGTKTVPVALNCSQRELMMITRDSVKSWVHERLPELEARLVPQIDKLDDLPFVHPYFWAGFYASGDL